MSSSSDLAFEGIVAQAKPFGRIDPHGGEVRLIAILPLRASGIEASRFAALQEARKGDLEIAHRQGRVTIEQTAVVCTVSGLRRLKGTLARDVEMHLGIITTIQ